MEQALEHIIDGLLCQETERIRQSTADLAQAFENPQTVVALCHIVASPRDAQIRQYAAVLLHKRLDKLRNWQLVPADQQEAVKQCMLQSLIMEKEKSVKNGIAQVVGSLVRHEADKKDSWLTELLKFIYDRCSMPDPKESELGSSIFATLTDTAPDQFVSHMGAICQMIAAVLVAAESRGDLTTPTVSNMMVSMANLMPFVSGHSTAEQTVIKIMPLIIQTLNAFAHKGVVDEFTTVFDIIDCTAEYVPKLLNNNVKSLLEFCLEIANNKQIDDAIRVQVVYFVGRIVRLKKKMIVKQKLLEPILTVIFDMMCSESKTEGDDYTEEFFTGESQSTPVTTATQTLDLLALNISPEKLIPPLLQLLEPALQSPDPLRRRAAFLCMAVIAEGCAEAICHKYLEIMLAIIKSGIADAEPFVRISAFFALGQFSEHLQPDISKFAPQILPVLFEFLHQLVVELKMGQPEPKHMDRMFYALETYCENLEDKIVPHLPLLMDRLFATLEPQNSIHVRELALSAISSTAVAAKEHLMPYFPQIVEILKVYLVKECPEEMAQLRIQAIDTLSSITRVVGKENYMHLADHTMSYCLMMLDEGPDDPDFRRAIYNLMGSLSVVVNESMSAVFPKIMDRIVESVISSEDVLPIVKDDATRNLYLDTISANGGNTVEIDLDNTDDEDDDDDDLDGFQVENDYLAEKEEAITALKDFAANTGNAFAPYLQSAFENVYKVIDHPQDIIRKVAIEAICEFVSALNRMGDTEGVRRACEIIMPKFCQIMRGDEEQTVVIHLLEVWGDLFKSIKQAAITSPEMIEVIFGCIKDALNNKMACQFNEPGGGGAGDEEDTEDSESEEQLIENAANLLPMLGHALEPQQFSLYFGRLFHFFTNKLTKAKRNDNPEQRAFVYGALADSFKSLGSCVATYFDTLCPIFIEGVTDTDDKARQNSYFGLGELVLNAEEKSFPSFSAILHCLSESIAREKCPSAMDNICGAVARMMVTNHQLMPLTHVLPVFLSNLPLREDKEENDMIIKAFRVIFMQARPSIEDHIERMLEVTMHVLCNKEIADAQSNENALSLVREIRQHYPDKFTNVSNKSPEIYSYMQSL